MSQTNSGDSAKNRDFALILRAVGAWIDAHSDASVFDPQQLSRELPQYGTREISRALDYLAEDGGFRPVYAVRTPTGVLADDMFPDPEEVPPQMRDRFDHPFSTEGSEILPMFEFVRR